MIDAEFSQPPELWRGEWDDFGRGRSEPAEGWSQNRGEQQDVME